MEKRKEDEIYCEEIDQNEIERAQVSLTFNTTTSIQLVMSLTKIT
jgi:hypothetical protein